MAYSVISRSDLADFLAKKIGDNGKVKNKKFQIEIKSQDRLGRDAFKEWMREYCESLGYQKNEISFTHLGLVVGIHLDIVVNITFSEVGAPPFRTFVKIQEVRTV